MSRTFLVTGATGATGRETVRDLLAAGAQVRALVHREDKRSELLREQGATPVVGDLLDFGTVRAAMEGVEGAYFVFPLLPGILQATTYFAQAAREAELRSVVNMSQISARREATSHAAQNHWIAEQVWKWSGVPVTHLRPTLFAEWALYFAGQVKSGTLALPFGTGRHALIAAEDQARVIAAILLAPEEHIGKTYPLYGPQEYTFEQITDEIGKVLNKPLRYQQISAQDLRERALSGSASAGREGQAEKHADNTLWQHFQEIAKDHQNGIFSGTNDTIERITGRKPMSLPDYLLAHRSELER